MIKESCGCCRGKKNKSIILFSLALLFFILGIFGPLLIKSLLQSTIKS